MIQLLIPLHSACSAATLSSAKYLCGARGSATMPRYMGHAMSRTLSSISSLVPARRDSSIRVTTRLQILSLDSNSITFEATSPLAPAGAESGVWSRALPPFSVSARASMSKDTFSACSMNVSQLRAILAAVVLIKATLAIICCSPAILHCIHFGMQGHGNGVSVRHSNGTGVYVFLTRDQHSWCPSPSSGRRSRKAFVSQPCMSSPLYYIYTHTHTPYTPIKTSPTIKTTAAETTLAYSS